MAFVRRPEFDPNRDFVTQTFFRVNGVPYERGVPFPKEEVDVRLLRRLYDTHQLGFRTDDPVEKDADLAPLTLEPTGGGWYQITVPWLDEPVKVQGEDKARFEAFQIREAGEPDEHHGVVMLEGENGWYSVMAEWQDEPERVHGRDAAYERATALRAEGPPAPAETPAPTETDPAFEQRVQALVDGYTREQLDVMAEGIEGADSAPNKPTLARMIVKAGLDQKADDGGAA